MNLRRDFTEPECEFLREVCNFTAEERRIFDMRVRDHSCVEVELALGMSEASLYRRIRNIKRKIARIF